MFKFGPILDGGFDYHMLVVLCMAVWVETTT